MSLIDCYHDICIDETKTYIGNAVGAMESIFLIMPDLGIFYR